LVLANIPFGLESRAVRLWYRLSGLRPSSRPFVSGDSFRVLAHHRFEPGSESDPEKIRKGEIVFVQATRLLEFARSALPQVRQPFVLVTHNGDMNIDGSCRWLAEEPKILRWFGQNAILRHPKLRALPIGLENRSLYYNGVLHDFKRLRRRSFPKALRILYAFTVGTNEVERRPAFAALQSCRFAEGFGRVNSRTYRARLSKFGFVASPPGNGIDCHRTWEALYLGVVPIVRRSPFYESFPGLPVLFVDDWSEVAAWDEDFLAASYERLSVQIASCPYLRFDYWQRLIEEAAHEVGRASS
jgi:hypothetical protein